MTIADPVTGLLPIEQALLNAGIDGSLENTDAVDALLRADPAFLSRNDAWHRDTSRPRKRRASECT